MGFFGVNRAGVAIENKETFKSVDGFGDVYDVLTTLAGRRARSTGALSGRALLAPELSALKKFLPSNSEQAQAFYLAVAALFAADPDLARAALAAAETRSKTNAEWAAFHREIKLVLNRQTTQDKLTARLDKSTLTPRESAIVVAVYAASESESDDMMDAPRTCGQRQPSRSAKDSLLGQVLAGIRFPITVGGGRVVMTLSQLISSRRLTEVGRKAAREATVVAGRVSKNLGARGTELGESYYTCGSETRPFAPWRPPFFRRSSARFPRTRRPPRSRVFSGGSWTRPRAMRPPCGPRLPDALRVDNSGKRDELVAQLVGRFLMADDSALITDRSLYGLFKSVMNGTPGMQALDDLSFRREHPGS